jgi:hypothetical protein
LLYVVFHDERRVCIAFDHWGAPLVISPPIEIEPGAVQRLTVAMGSLFPPTESVEYAGATHLRAWRDRLLVRLNGRTVFSRAQSFHDALPSSVTIGACATGATTAEATFTGEMLSSASSDLRKLSEELPPIPPVRGGFFGDSHGAVEMQLQFPRDLTGRSESLLSSGKTGSGDLLSVTYLDERHVRFAFDHWGAPPLLSRVFKVQPGATHRIIASIGSLFPPLDDPSYRAAPHLRLLKQWLFVSLNDEIVFSQPFACYTATPDSVTFGESRLGASTGDPRFTGTVLELRRRHPDALGLNEHRLASPPLRGERLPGGYMGAIELDVRLPAEWDPGIEPLLVTGDVPDADVVFLKYRGSKQIQLGYRHGSGAIELSAPLPTEPGKRHTLTISTGSLYPSPGSPWARTSLESVRLKSHTYLAIDGAFVLLKETASFSPDPRSVFFGVSRVEAKWFRPRFSGRVLDARRVNVEPSALADPQQASVRTGALRRE